MNLKKLPLFIFFGPIILITIYLRQIEIITESDYWLIGPSIIIIWSLTFILRYKQAIKGWFKQEKTER